ncbi:DUF3152 domain-containing protein [Streptomyces acidicola]|uniref:DUF3152 domain-containing protein n=1 Tax=Streptomyces acidicola TaxID=2596892 RepID=UPI00378F0833
MGRHSRKGRPAKGGTTETPVAPAPPVPGATGMPVRGTPRHPDGTPPQGVPRFADGAPSRGAPRMYDGTPAQGVPRFPGAPGTPSAPGAHGGTPAQRVPRLPDGTPARGVPRPPRFPDGTPAQGTPQVRGGHPEQREQGGGWGKFAAAGPAQAMQQEAPAGYADPRIPRQRQQPVPGHGPESGEGRSGAPGAGPGPRQAYLDAFEGADEAEEALPGEAPGSGKGKGGKGRTFTGIAAAAVTTVLAVVVAGQVTVGRDGVSLQSQADEGSDRDSADSASRSDDRPRQSVTPSATPLTYDEKMGKRNPLAADLEGNGKFQAVMGFDRAPGTGQKYRYRVDVEEGLGLDAELFADAVQKTLNDDRSWAQGGGRTFERISSGKPDFVITLASPGTTADWCAKSGLDTTVDNVSCDSAATDRVMINAYRWAQGSKTYGDKMFAYRQMLINHEVGHRLGYGHVTCDKDGELAPVMQQQTKFLDHGVISCRANPWPFPGS